MFKLAAFTDEISQDLAHACAVCREFGVTGAEIRGVWETNVAALSDAQVADIRRIVADHGMTVCSIGSPFGKCELDDPAAVAAHMEMLRRCAAIGHALDCRMVRGFVFWGHGRIEKPWDVILRAYEPVPRILESLDIVLGVENEAACCVGTAGHLRTFLDKMQCDRIRAVWDPANHVHDPEGAAIPPYPDGYALLKDDIVHVHMKDAGPGPDGVMQNVFLGTGRVDWAGQLQALKDDGYAGYVSLETHVNPEDLPEGLRPRYGRYCTGQGREGASRVCLAWVRDAVSALA